MLNIVNMFLVFTANHEENLKEPVDIQEPSEDQVLLEIKPSKKVIKNMQNEELENLQESSGKLEADKEKTKKEKKMLREIPKNKLLKKDKDAEKQERHEKHAENVIKTLKTVLEKSNIELPKEIVDKTTDKKDVKEKSDEAKKDDGKSEKIIIVKQTTNTENKEDEKNKKIEDTTKHEQPEGSNLSDIMFTPTIKTKEEILRKKDSVKLLENQIKMKKLVHQMNILVEENDEILSKFKENTKDELEHNNGEKARDITKYKVIEVTDSHK